MAALFDVTGFAVQILPALIQVGLGVATVVAVDFDVPEGRTLRILGEDARLRMIAEDTTLRILR